MPKICDRLTDSFHFFIIRLWDSLYQFGQNDEKWVFSVVELPSV